MLDSLFWGGFLRGSQALLQASPYIVTGLVIAGVFQTLLGPVGLRKLFGHGTWRALPQAWVIGMLLPICSLGAIPVIRQMRRAGLTGGTILAFALSAPLFNPLSLLYGLTLSEPLTIFAFGICTLLVVTSVGLIWDRLFPQSDVPEMEHPRVPYGLRRMLAVAQVGARELCGPSLLYIVVGLSGVVALAFLLPPGSLQRAMGHKNSWAPLLMAGIALPAYATPMMAMSQLGSMFQHGNSVGAAFTLLTLGAGTNLGLVLWMHHTYGLKRAAVWLGLLLAVILVLSYGVERPLYPTAIEPADHTHAFDIYCRPFIAGTPDLARRVWDKIRQETQIHEAYGACFLAAFLCAAAALRLFDSRRRVEAWLERQPAQPAGGPAWYNASLSAPVLGMAALGGVVVLSLVGCYTYYPPPDEALEQIANAGTEAMSAAITGDRRAAEHWIPIYADWVRKLQVGVYLRTGTLSEYHRAKARLIEERLELLQHEVVEGDTEEIHRMVFLISRSFRRLCKAYREEPQVPDSAAPLPMPEHAAVPDEHVLFLTAKGKYTVADIAANGNTTPSEKYKDFHASHNFDPKPGETICPVTRTAANANCLWIVGGKKYFFCCPPCISEFVRCAKENPEKIQEPQDYLKR
jgi:uncharacterized protein